MVDTHLFLVPRVFLFVCAVYILSMVVVVESQSPQFIQHHCIIIQVFTHYNFTPNCWDSDFVTDTWVEGTQYWSAYNGFLLK